MLKKIYKKIIALRNKIVYSNLNKKNKIKKLHIGCGAIYKEGWINIDNNSDKNIKKIDLVWDLRKKLPFPGNSVDFIYSEHFIEHLTYQQGQELLKNLFNIIKKKGVLRIACPDLKKIINGYYYNNWREQSWVKDFNFSWIKSRCEMVNICVNKNQWGHQYVYDEEDLKRALRDVGFKKIKKEKFKNSKYPELKNLETRKDSLIIEAIK